MNKFVLFASEIRVTSLLCSSVAIEWLSARASRSMIIDVRNAQNMALLRALNQLISQR